MKPASNIAVAGVPSPVSKESEGRHEVLTMSTASSHVACKPEPPPEQKPGPPRAAGSLGLVLVADDSPSVRELLAGTLTEEGYDVVLAANGQEALEKFRSGHVDLVLLDLEMPVKNGWQAFEEMVSLNENQAIILMTEQVSSVDLITTGHLTRLAEKPIHLPTLLVLVGKALAESAVSRRSTLASQQNLARYAKPYTSSFGPIESYEHWGLND
jgi:CheY-like chemotaxis protein